MRIPSFDQICLLTQRLSASYLCRPFRATAWLSEASTASSWYEGKVSLKEGLEHLCMAIDARIDRITRQLQRRFPQVRVWEKRSKIRGCSDLNGKGPTELTTMLQKRPTRTPTHKLEDRKPTHRALQDKSMGLTSCPGANIHAGFG